MITPAPVVDIRLSRRQLLHVGVMGSAILSTAGLFGSAVRALASAPDAGEFLALSPAGRDILRAVAPAVLEGSLPTDAAARTAAIDDIIRTVDSYLAYLPESVQAEAEQVFSLLRFAPVRILLARVWSTWPEASADEVAAFLRAWRISSFGLLRSVYVFLQSMVSIGWFDQPIAWKSMGYPGPPVAGTAEGSPR